MNGRLIKHQANWIIPPDAGVAGARKTPLPRRWRLELVDVQSRLWVILARHAVTPMTAGLLPTADPPLQGREMEKSANRGIN